MSENAKTSLGIKLYVYTAYAENGQAMDVCISDNHQTVSIHMDELEARKLLSHLKHSISMIESTRLIVKS